MGVGRRKKKRTTTRTIDVPNITINLVVRIATQKKEKKIREREV